MTEVSPGEDPGEPISYVLLAAGTAVYSSQGTQVAKVSHVLADEEADIFDGIVIGDLDHGVFAGGDRHRFVDAPEVGSIHERAVALTIDDAACRALPGPSANPGASAEGGVSAKLHRAWDRLSGNY